MAMAVLACCFPVVGRRMLVVVPWILARVCTRDFSCVPQGLFFEVSGIDLRVNVSGVATRIEKWYGGSYKEVQGGGTLTYEP